MAVTDEIVGNITEKPKAAMTFLVIFVLGLIALILILLASPENLDGCDFELNCSVCCPCDCDDKVIQTPVNTSTVKQNQTSGKELQAAYLKVVDDCLAKQGPMGIEICTKGKAQDDYAAWCRKENGVFGPQGMMGLPNCNLPATDSGKNCTDGTECDSGTCIAPDGAKSGQTNLVGTCNDWMTIVGCYTYLDNGESIEICVD